MRKVLVSKIKYQHGVGRIADGEPYEANFHAWGCNFEEFENGAGNYSVAIVELADGSIESISNPEWIKFIDNK